MDNTFTYNPRRVGTFYYPNVGGAMAAGKALNLPGFWSDKRKVMLLNVDPQIDFIHEGRPLAVPGAIDDTRRTIEWIYRNIAELTYIATSLDTHLPFQIFFPSWFVDAQGRPVNPFTTISTNELNKTVFPAIDFTYTYAPGKSMLWSEYYITKLQQSNKQVLVTWPYHTMLGTPGHAIDPALYEAIMYHAGARMSQPKFEIKGSVPQTENYSIMEVEVLFSGDKAAGINEDFLNILTNFDLVYIAGQAKSHCVLETILSIQRYFAAKAPEVLSRIRILEDCTSAVSGFEAMADQAFAELSRQGLRLVKSTDPIG